MRIKKSKHLITFVLSVLMGLSGHTLAAEVASDAAIPSELTAKGLKKPDYSLLVAAESVLPKIKQKIILVDIRKPGEFERISIPGSINIALHFIKTKSFLKLKPLVLVNAGYQYSQMEEECRSLRNKGFKVSILAGGITSWHRNGGPLKGDLRVLNDYNKISPRIFSREKNYANQIVIDVSKEQSEESKKLIPSAIHIPVADNPETAVLQLKKTISKPINKPYLPVVIFNENGDQYDKIETIMQKKGLENTFYLTGGLKAYKRFLQHLTLSRQSRGSRLKRVDKCPNCGPAKETASHVSQKHKE